MKANYFKALLLLVTFLTASSSFSQAVYSERYPKMRFGLNMGGIWQTNDILKNKAGFAGGVTLEKVLNKKDDAILGFSLGFRYLGGYSKGFDNRKNIALKSNTSLNTADSATNYFIAPGYFYNNYRTSHNEGAFELKMNFPKFEKRTSLVFHLFGGIGAAKYNTKINALNFESKYDLSNFSTTQPSLAEIEKMYDFTYETPADGNAGNGNIVLAPSGGVGFGVRFSKNFSWVIEHRVTFPRVDVLDGHQWKDDVTKTDRNDYYHYTSAHFIFTFYGGGKGNISSNTNTNVTTNTNTQTNLNNTPKPIINVYTPVTNPYNTTSNVQQVSGTIKYVTSSAGVSINVNGMPLSSFDFNPNNGSFAFNTNLNSGVNNVTITATNSAGQDSETIQINYSAPQFNNQPIVAELPPKVVITYPSNNYVSATSSTNVNSVISNISSSSNIAVSVNGAAISNFNYNSFSGALNFVASLNAGNNSIVVSAFNSAGNDAQQIFVKYTPVSTTQIITPKGEAKPVVSFHNPPSSPYESAIKVFNVTAHVSNVTAANQIAVNYNGAPVTNFTFNPYGFVNFNVSLNVGSNSIAITGTNTAGSDVKYAVINYKESGKAPIVTIIEPAQNPFVTELASYNVVSKFENVQNQGDINVMLNGSLVPFTYNTVNHTATIQANLNPGKNTVIVSAANGYGSDSKTQVIERTVKLVRKPLVTIINPAVTSFNSLVPSQQVVAQVFNVSAASEIKVNGAANVLIPFNYDATTQQISFLANLTSGANTYVVTATNTAGSDSKSVTINYTPKSTPILEKPPVVTFVNPAENPYSTFDLSMNVIATVTNIATQQGITVKLNGVATNFTFNPITKEVLIPSALNIGSNTIIVTASNLAGSDAKTQIIDRKEMNRCLLSPVVNIITPAVSPYNTINATEAVRAEVLNVTGSSSIQVTNQQGQAVNFTYDANSHFVDFTGNLVAGNNTFKVKATNSVDAVSKSLDIVYTKTVTATQVPVKVAKPIVSFVTPSQANTTIQVASQAISASVANVTNVTGIAVQVNGQAYTSFTFVNGVVAFTLTCNEGSNTITVTGTNVAGSDSKTIFVNYEKPAPPLPLPVVTFISPATLSTVTISATQNVQASILNITSASQAQVQVNGATVSDFTYANGAVNFVANLNVGNNTVLVKGTNASGTDSKTISIIYEKRQPLVVVSPPVLSYVVPTSNTLATSNATEEIRMTVTNVTTASQLSVKVNGVSVSNFTLNYGVINFSTNLSIGANSILVTATNTAGTDSKAITIARQAPPAPTVTITNPSTNPYTSAEPNITVNATVANVAGYSEITVTAGGNAVPFVYNSVTDLLNFSYVLTGNTTFVVSASNVNGSDSKSLVVNYSSQTVVNDPKIRICHYPDGPTSTPISIDILASEWPAHELHGDAEGNCVVINPPVVTFINPSSANSTTLNGAQNISAKVTNVSSLAQVTVLVNNAPITNFTLTNGNVAFGAALTIGANTVKVTGTNNGGTDSKTITITRQAPPAPSVTITNPTANPYTSATANISVTATVNNVANASEINVTANGTTIPFTYNGASNSVNLSYVLTGNTTFVVSASNSNGSDSKTLVVNYSEQTVVNDPKIRICHYPNGPTSTPVSIDILASEWPAHEAHGDSEGNCVVINPPVVSFISPAAVNSTTQNGTQNISAKVTNVTSISQVTVLLNNNPITNFTLTNGNVGFGVALAIGANTIKVTGTNNSGTDSKTITITRQAPPAPTVTITNPTANPYTSTTANISVAASVVNVASASEISVTANGNVIPFTYNAASNGLNFSYVLTGNITFVVSASNANGSDSKNLVVNYTVPVVDPEIVICHKPPGNPTNTQQLTIPQSAWAAHQAHGDELGTCPPAVTTPTVTPDPEIVICHKPPGNPTNTQQLTIPQSAWLAHQAHGDELGTCPPAVTTPTVTPDPEIVICHKPPGNPTNTQQLTIPQSAWAAHQAHGDVLGTCPVVVNPPVVSITNPSSQNSTTVNTVQSVAATITGVTSSSQVSVLVNGTSLSSFTFANGNVNFVAALSMGSNTIKITGTNEGGNDSKTVTVTRQAPPAPSVTITKPTSNPFTSNEANINIKATVSNVAYASEINVTAGGSVIPFNYNVASDVLTLDYVLTGNTTFVIAASNANGSDSKTLVVNYTVPVVDPEIVICHKPPGNPENTQQLTIPQSAWAAHQAHGDVLGACPPAVTTPTVTPEPEIVICHKPPGNPTNTQQLTIPQSAWPAHQAHGDELGACPTPTVTPNNGNNNGGGNNNGNNGGGNGKTITICHIPPGNNSNPQQITIPESAWPAHEAHGDSKGNCPTVQNVDGGKGGNNNGNGNKDNKDNTPGTLLNGIKGLMTPKTNTTQPINNTPKTNTNTQPTNTTPKATEPKKEEPKVTPRTVQPTTTAPATVAPTTPPKATTPSTVTEGTSSPRVIKPR